MTTRIFYMEIYMDILFTNHFKFDKYYYAIIYYVFDINKRTYSIAIYVLIDR